MPTFLVAFVSKLAGLGAVAKTAAVATALATLGATGGAVAVLGQPDSTSARIEAAHPVIGAGEAVVDAPVAHTVPTTVAPVQPATAGAPATVPTTRPPAATRTTQPAAPPTTAAVKTSAGPAASASASAAPVRASGVARRIPSSAEVLQAIKTLPQYVKTLIKPTPAQVAELGNRVCTAFDEGQTFTEVKATGLEMVTMVPRTTVLPGGADWVVRTTVTLYCPGHASKLV